MGAPSIMNMDIAPVSAIACNVAIVIALRYWGVGVLNRCRAVAANDGREARCAYITCWAHAAREQFDVAIVTSSLLHTFTIWVGSKGWAEIKLLHLFAMYSFTPPCQYPDSWLLCIPLVHRSHPTFRYSCALARVKPSWWLGFLHNLWLGFILCGAVFYGRGPKTMFVVYTSEVP